MKKFAICSLLFAICAATAAHADDVSVGRAAITSAAAAKSAAAAPTSAPAQNSVVQRTSVSQSAPTRASVAAQFSPPLGGSGAVGAEGGLSSESNAIAPPSPALPDSPPQGGGQSPVRTAVTNNAVIGTATASRIAVQNVTAARAATGDEAAQQALVRQSISRGDVARAAITGSGQSRAAAMAAAQAEERESERAEFHSNEKGVANESSAVRRAGVSLRPTVAEVGGRATIGDTDKMTGSNIATESGRVATARAATSMRPTAASIAETTEKLTLTSSLQDSCTQQYMDCMDQFCNVLDANQGRCSCSDRLSTYTKTERAVKEANNQLNEVAQRIRYVGLSADEIRAIMKATEAELAMQGQRDTTENRSMLEQIEKLIKNPETFVNEANNNSLDLDFNIDFESMDFDEIFNLDMFGNTSSFSNMRGVALYNAAKNKCKNILNTCKTNGANSSQISARYDMEIDKACIAFEKGLERMNQTLKTNVRAATSMLQQARLAVLNNQNSLDAKGCVGALESCMTDDMVCGDSYIKCMDPTKNYIDENGIVVLGRDITNIRRFMDAFSAAEIKLSDATGLASLTESTCKASPNNDGRCIVRYLLNKIGMGESATSGLCRVVLDKCQRVSYKNGKYDPTNYVVQNFIQRAMVNIKANQEQVIAEYASTCMQDVAYCYSQQVSQLNAWSTSASVASIQTIMSSACRNVALTCGFAIFSVPSACTLDGVTPEICFDNKCRLDNGYPENPAAWTTDDVSCIYGVSEIFYQTMLCPENSVFTIPAANQIPTAGKIWASNDTAATYTNRVWLNERCMCNPGYGYLSGRCVLQPSNSAWVGATCVVTNLTGQCAIVGYSCTAGSNGFIPQNGTCVQCPTGKTAANGQCT